MPEGDRIVRRFLKSDSVKAIFGFVKGEVEAAKGRVFEVCLFTTEARDVETAS